MRKNIQAFITYLHDVKGTSKNTEMSYERDLRKMADYFESTDKTSISKVTADDLKTYVKYLEKQGKKPATISRNIASIKAFYQYLLQEKVVKTDFSADLKAPKVEKKVPVILSVEETEKLLNQPGNKTDKEIRDKAMLELLYATGIRVTELITLKVSDVNLKEEQIVAHTTSGKSRVIPIGKMAKKSLQAYMGDVRDRMKKTEEDDVLFINCSGSSMSRQGFWKVLKFYAKKAGIETDITPHTLRHSFAAHMVHNGADLHAVQEMMGHSDISSTQIYVQMENSEIKNEYAKAHPRG